MPEAKRKQNGGKPEGAALTARARWLRYAALGLLGASAVGAVAAAASSCSGWDPRSPFERNAPEVDQAIRDLDAGNLPSAEEALESYLGTGACSDGGIAVSDAVKKKPNGGFDLGLVLFYVAERFGHRFGDEELSDGGEGEAQQAEQRSTEIDCALPLVKAIASDPSVPADLRARAYYLAGNLEFLRRKYEDAVKNYDQALAIVPGVHEEAGGDGIGRDAAWNRAIALRRIQDQKDAGQDASDDAPDGDDGSDAADAPDSDDGSDGSDGGEDGGDSGDGGNQPDSGGNDGGNDGGKGDAGGDAGPKDQQEPDGGAPADKPPQKPPQEAPAPQQDERMLDQLEEAPTYQEQEAKARAATRRGRATMEDK